MLHERNLWLSDTEEWRGTRQGSVSHARLLRGALLKSNHVTHEIYIYVYIYNKNVKLYIESWNRNERLAGIPLANRKNPPLKFASRESSSSHRHVQDVRFAVSLNDRMRHNDDTLISFLNCNCLAILKYH